LAGWATRSFLAVLDQGLLSSANFILQVSLARWLLPHEYGAFALVFAVYMFFFGIHYALVQEPASVLGHVRHQSDPEGYCAATSTIHAWLSVAMAAPGVVVAAGLLLVGRQGDRSFAAALLGMSLFLPFTLLLWLTRRIAYLSLQPRLALTTSLLYAGFLLLPLVVLERAGRLSPAVAYALMGAASVVASTWLLGALAARSVRAGFPWELLREHWQFGKWLVALSLVQWLSKDAYYFLTAGFLGSEPTAAFRALNNLVTPLEQILTALGVLLLPWLSSRWVTGSREPIRHNIAVITLAETLIVLAYIAVVSWMAVPLLQLLYRGKYSAFAWMVPGLTVVQFFRAVSAGCLLGLLASRNPRPVFWAGFAGAVVTLTVGVALVKFWSLKGLVLGLGLSAGVNAVCLLRYSRRGQSAA
jgi:O-antigen/teichoic acid export membrane protein